MRTVDRLFVHARELVTLTDGPERGYRRGPGARELGVIRDGAVAVADGRIVEVGPTDQVARRCRAREELDLSGYSVVPGFVDPEAFPVFRRGAGAAVVTGRREVLAAAAHEHLWSMVEHGTTAAAARAGTGQGVDAEAGALGALRDAVAEVPIRVRRTWQVPGHGDQEAEAAMAVTRDVLLPVVRGVADSVALRCGDGGVSPEGVAAFVRAADELGLAVHVECDRADSLASTELAVGLGVRACHHLGRVSRAGQTALARGDSAAVLVPARYLLEGGMRFAPGRALLDAGCAVALASGFGPEVAVASQPAACALAVACMGFSPEEALVAATINAAVALGFDAECGTLHPGKRADLAVIDASAWPRSGLGLGSNPVVLTVAEGEPVFANTHEPMPEVVGMSSPEPESKGGRE